jgi:hypothetical protein
LIFGNNLRKGGGGFGFNPDDRKMFRNNNKGCENVTEIAERIAWINVYTSGKLNQWEWVDSACIGSGLGSRIKRIEKQNW